MGTPGQNVRRLIRAARERKDWSQADLARAARVSRGTVQNLENGMSLREGKESLVEGALDLAVGTIDKVRSGALTVEKALGQQPAVGNQPPPLAEPNPADYPDDLEYLNAVYWYLRNQRMSHEAVMRGFTMASAIYERRRREQLTDRDRPAAGGENDGPIG